MASVAIGEVRPVRENGMKIWEGPSVLNPAKTVIVIVTGLIRKSKNPKTDDMYQGFILLKDTPPHHAVKTGEDEAVCGDCLLRPFLRELRLKAGLKRPCYVKAYQAPLSVWKAHKDKPVTPPEEARLMLMDKPFRYGAYGDPAAVPAEAWAAVPRGGE
tara:strand:- start:3425 stop:3898 length:474 start_codon:yes stop_codon:yes gene_type:complete